MKGNLMNIKDLADYLQMNKMTIYKLAREGKLPAFKVASEWRFRRDLIDKWLMGQLKGDHEFAGLESEAKQQTGNTVLIVDDEEIIRDFFARTLSNEYRVITATNGEEALGSIRSDRPDLVLLDIQMPGIDGIETLRRIKQIDEGIIVVMLSAYGTLERNMEAARLGAYTSIAKPFDSAYMDSAIRNALLSGVIPQEEAAAMKKPGKRKSG